MEQLCDDWVTKNKKTGLIGLFSKGLNPFVYLGPENAFMVLLKKMVVWLLEPGQI